MKNEKITSLTTEEIKIVNDLLSNIDYCFGAIVEEKSSKKPNKTHLINTINNLKILAESAAKSIEGR